MLRFTPAAPRSVASPPAGPDWLHEIKFDGWRLVVSVDSHRITLVTKNGHDVTKRFDTLAASLSSLTSRRLILDAELVAIDDQGKCDFYALHRGNPSCLVIRTFDLLHYGDKDLRPLPLIVRRARLSRLVAAAHIPTLLMSEAFDDGRRLFSLAADLGLEGIVSKRKSEPYREGTSCRWTKCKTEHWKKANRQRWRLFEHS